MKIIDLILPNRVLEKFVPTWMGNKMGVFRNAALSVEYGKCKKYSC